MRAKLDERYATYVQASEKEKLLVALQQAEDWLYEDGAAQSAPVFRYATVTHPHACHPVDIDAVWKRR